MGPRFLLADDHAILRDGVKLILGDAFKGAEFGEASSSSETLALVSSSQPWDLILLDLSMPGRGGMDVLKDIHSQNPSVSVLILSMYDDLQFIVRAFRNGAKGFLAKANAAKELVAAIKRILDGHHYLSPGTSDSLLTDLGRARGDLLSDRLSDREFEILRRIAQGMTIKGIAAEFGLSINTISTYRARILEKTNLHNNAEIMRYAFLNRLTE